MFSLRLLLETDVSPPSLGFLVLVFSSRVPLGWRKAIRGVSYFQTPAVSFYVEGATLLAHLSPRPHSLLLLRSDRFRAEGLKEKWANGEDLPILLSFVSGSCLPTNSTSPLRFSDRKFCESGPTQGSLRQPSGVCI